MSFHPLEVLAHVERRRILAALTADDDVSIPAFEPPAFGETANAEILNEVLFYHLPKMADHGYVSFDRSDGTVSRGPRFRALRPYLDSRNGHRGPADPE